MRRALLLSLAAALLLPGLAQAQTEGWVSVLWRTGEPPIVTPVIYRSEAACQNDAKALQAIARDTVKIVREWKCQHVFVDRSASP